MIIKRAEDESRIHPLDACRESRAEFIAGPRLTERYTAVKGTAVEEESFGVALARSERYKAVEGMLFFLDAQAEHRVCVSA